MPAMPLTDTNMGMGGSPMVTAPGDSGPGDWRKLGEAVWRSCGRIDGEPIGITGGGVERTEDRPDAVRCGGGGEERV